MIYLCIPAHNEEQTVGVVLWKIRQVLTEFPRDYQILVADDASTDRTAEVLAPYARVLPLTILRARQQRGYAASLEMLLREACRRSPYPKRDAIVVMQADFTDEPEDIVPLIKKIEQGADIVGGIPATDTRPPLLERWLLRWQRRLLKRVEWPDDCGDPLSAFRSYRVYTVARAIDRAGSERLLHWDSPIAGAELLQAAAAHARRVESIDLAHRPDRRQRPSRASTWETLKRLRRFVRGANPLATVPLAELSPETLAPPRPLEIERERRSEAAVPERGRNGRGARNGRNGAGRTGEARSGRAGTRRAQSGRGESGRAESGRAQSGRAESGRAQSGRAESGRAESGRAESGRRDRTRRSTNRPAAQAGADTANGENSTAERSTAETQQRPARRRKKPAAAAGNNGTSPETAPEAVAQGNQATDPAAEPPKKKRRRRRRRRSGGSSANGEASASAASASAAAQPDQASSPEAGTTDVSEGITTGSADGAAGAAGAANADGEPRKKRRRRGGRRGGRGRRRKPAAETAGEGQPAPTGQAGPAPATEAAPAAASVTDATPTAATRTYAASGTDEARPTENRTRAVDHVPVGSERIEND